MTSPSRAQRLLDAQVAWLVGQLTGPDAAAAVERDLRELLDAETRVPLGRLVTVHDAQRAVRTLLAVAPASTGASTIVQMLADVAYDGPASAYTLSEVVAREDVERITDEALAHTDVVRRLLDDVSASPLASGLASRFVGRLVNEMLQSNRAAAEKVPGVGALVSFGLGAAGAVAGAATGSIDAVLGDVTSKGAAIAAKRLNRVLVDTLSDPAARAAVLEVYDLYADHPIPHLRDVTTREEVRRIAGLAQDVTIDGAARPAVLELADAVVAAFWGVYGEHPASALLLDLGIDREAAITEGVRVATDALAVAHENGDLERILRDRLAPFYDSAEVAAVLAE
ncbi:hypothetical protein GCM10028801_12940 [Nocardioides maradonensis]